MPWPSVSDAQHHRMEITNGKSIDIDGREVFADLYRHVIADRKVRRVNVMGTKGIGKSHCLAALVGLLLKQVCIGLHIFAYSSALFAIDMSDLVCFFAGPSCGLLAQLRCVMQYPVGRSAFGADGCLWRR